tara:strand:- start:1 stop:651 length:651 start_codon:yes stop_codon:yes gene_type:complete
MSRKYKGLFISFEGGEASGKTTQIKKIKKWLKDKKLPYIITREPGGTKLAETLRKIILSSKDKISTDLEVLLLISSRIDHINRVINPALIKNKIVVCDRFVDSTAIYQGYYGKFGVNKVYQLHKQFLNNILPNLTFFFNTTPKVVRKRLNKRRYKNKYDLIDQDFNKRINNGFFKIAKNNKRFIIIDASLPIKEIHDIIVKNIIKKLLSYGVRVSK